MEQAIPRIVHVSKRVVRSHRRGGKTTVPEVYKASKPLDDEWSPAEVREPLPNSGAMEYIGRDELPMKT